MSEPSTPHELPLSLSGERRVDAVCLQFEKEWQAGRSPRIEEHLAQAPEAERPALLPELLRLELDYRSRRGECPTADEYRTRYPGHEALLAQLSDSLPRLHLPGYEILGELGRGGMGVVYRARQIGLDRMVALKCILAGRLAGQDEVKRFEMEARAAAALDHPNIVSIHDVGEHQGQHFFTMKLVPGPSLAEQVASGPLPSRRAAELMVLVARAVQHAHSAGILHRDLKPANILLDAKGQPHVTDFGLARRLDGQPGITQSGAVVGTPGYMAPEQVAGHSGQLSPATDVYGLGAVLYALLTGRPPFQAATVWDTLLQLQRERPAPPRLLNSRIDRDLETICLKCLEKEPAARYPSAAEVAEDLERYLRREPIRAKPPTWLGSVIRQIVSNNIVEPLMWRAVSWWGAGIVASVHILVYFLIQTGYNRPFVGICYIGTLLAMWGMMGVLLRRRKTPLTKEERYLLGLWLAHTLGLMTSWVAAGAPQDAKVWNVYPVWATLYGVCFFVQGSLYWGRFYLVGLTWFGLALLIPLKPEWAPLEYALLYAVTMGIIVRFLSPARSPGNQPDGSDRQ